MGLLRSRSTPGRAAGRGMGPNVEDRATQFLGEAMPGARGPQRERSLPQYDQGGMREDMFMQGQPLEEQLAFAARQLQERAMADVGQSGVDLGDHAALRQAGVRAGNLAAGKPQGYAPSPRMGTDDPRMGQQYRNQFDRAIQGLLAARG